MSISEKTKENADVLADNAANDTLNKILDRMSVLEGCDLGRGEPRDWEDYA
jgi:hypothetical protein